MCVRFDCAMMQDQKSKFHYLCTFNRRLLKSFCVKGSGKLLALCIENWVKNRNFVIWGNNHMAPYKSTLANFLAMVDIDDVERDCKKDRRKSGEKKYWDSWEQGLHKLWKGLSLF